MPQLASAPTGATGAMYYNTTSNQVFFYIDGEWVAQTNTANILPFTDYTSLTCFGAKSQTIPANTTAVAWDSDIFTNYNYGGVLNRLWIAVNCPSVAGLQISFDGATGTAIQIGNANSPNSGTTGLNTLGLGLPQVLAGGVSNVGINYFTESFGSSYNLNPGAVAGYITFDAPFSSRLQVYLSNTSTTTALTYWIQPFITTMPREMYIPPLRLYCKTFSWTSTVYNTEYPLLSIPGGSVNGVYLKAVKMQVAGLSGNWWESRFRMYTGGTGMPVPLTPATGYSDDFQVSNPYQVENCLCIWTSSGTEDFSLSSYNYGQTPLYANDTSSLLYNSVILGATAYGASGPVGPTSTVSFYRVFGERGGALPAAPTETTFVVSWTSGDPQVGLSGSVTTFGNVWYYA